MRKLVSIIIFWASCMALSAQELVTVKGSGKMYVQTNANAYVHGGVLLENGSLLSNTGTITVKEIGASGVSNWTDQTTTPYLHGSGTVIFNGTGGHIATSPNTFGKIHVNTIGHLTHGSDINTNTLLLDNGRVNTTTSYKMIVLNTPENAIDKSASNNGFANSWVNGNLRRYITPASVNQYLFPVGNMPRSNVAMLGALMAQPINNVNYVDAWFSSKAGTDANLNVLETGLLAYNIQQYYTSVSNGGVWYLIPDATPTSGKFNLQLFFDGFTGLLDNSFGIIKRPQASTEGSHWMIPSGTTLDINGMPGRILANGYAQRNLLNEFGQFGIGIFSTPLNVSSIELFAERITRSKVQLNWESREPNTVLGYDVERRLDRESVYSKRVYVQSKGGNSENEIDRYTYLDENNYPGISYYRLRQFLVNDAPRYTSIKAVKGMGDGSVSVTVFPNPSIGDFNIRIAGTEQSFEGFLLDMKGIVVNRFSMSSQKLLKVHHLAAGTYFLQIQDVFGKGYSFREKIIITHH